MDALNALALPGEILVMDDGSADRTAEVAAAHGARVIRRAANAGYGRTVKDGIGEAAHDVIVVTDADGTYPLEQIPALLEMFAGGYDMVVGARHGKAYRGRYFKMPARRVLRAIAEFTTGRSIPDVNSGLRVFRGSAAKPHFPDLCNGFSFLTTITLVYMLTGRTVGYMPIPYHPRIGRSKVKIVRDSLRTLQYMTETMVRFNPLKLFLLLTMLTLLLGIVAGWLFGFGAFFAAIFCALLVFALGLVAEAMKRR